MSLTTRMLSAATSRAPGRPARHAAIEASSVLSSGVYRACGLVSLDLLGERHRRILRIEALARGAVAGQLPAPEMLVLPVRPQAPQPRTNNSAKSSSRYLMVSCGFGTRRTAWFTGRRTTWSAKKTVACR